MPVRIAIVHLICTPFQSLERQLADKHELHQHDVAMWTADNKLPVESQWRNQTIQIIRAKYHR